MPRKQPSGWPSLSVVVPPKTKKQLEELKVYFGNRTYAQIIETALDDLHKKMKI